MAAAHKARGASQHRGARAHCAGPREDAKWVIAQVLVWNIADAVTSLGGPGGEAGAGKRGPKLKVGGWSWAFSTVWWGWDVFFFVTPSHGDRWHCEWVEEAAGRSWLEPDPVLVGCLAGEEVFWWGPGQSLPSGPHLAATWHTSDASQPGRLEEAVRQLLLVARVRPSRPPFPSSR